MLSKLIFGNFTTVYPQRQRYLIRGTKWLGTLGLKRFVLPDEIFATEMVPDVVEHTWKTLLVLTIWEYGKMIQTHRSF